MGVKVNKNNKNNRDNIRVGGMMEKVILGGGIGIGQVSWGWRGVTTTAKMMLGWRSTDMGK